MTWKDGGRVLAEGGVAFILLFAALDGWTRDFSVPLYFSYDALEYLMQVKGTIENGWWWVHPRLSAPGAFAQVLYPSNTTVDQAIVWLVRLVTREPGLVINASWMIMVALSAVVATRCVSLLGPPRALAVPAGLLFALSPYALYKHIDHFSLAIYLVPVPCAVALSIAAGRAASLSRRERMLLAVGCALLGFNYPYYAFFGCFLVLVAAAVAFAAERRASDVMAGLTFVGIICLATFVNFTPSFYAWTRDGKPAAIPQKQAAEAEQYGLKIRQLVSPVVESSFPPFRRWTTLEDAAQYPLQTENRSARLGTVATLGFLALLCGLFVPKLGALTLDDALFAAAARLTLAALLLATIGGFGSVFNLLVTPEIRAYSRITPFIAFFSGIAVVLIAEKLLAVRPYAASIHRLAPSLIPAALAAVAALGLYDQTRAAVSLNEEHDGVRREWTALARFVASLERALPAGAQVFQLPQLTFLAETGQARMLPLDHIKPYIVSNHIHWSYPALADSVVSWQQRVSRLPPRALAAALADKGFGAVLVDRHGYPDGGRSLVESLTAGAVAGRVIAESDRYVAIDVPRVLGAAAPVN
jgi:phosphoglycerol transferase